MKLDFDIFCTNNVVVCKGNKFIMLHMLFAQVNWLTYVILSVANIGVKQEIIYSFNWKTYNKYYKNLTYFSPNQRQLALNLIAEFLHIKYRRWNIKYKALPKIEIFFLIYEWFFSLYIFLRGFLRVNLMIFMKTKD